MDSPGDDHIPQNQEEAEEDMTQNETFPQELDMYHDSDENLDDLQDHEFLEGQVTPPLSTPAVPESKKVSVQLERSPLLLPGLGEVVEEGEHEKAIYSPVTMELPHVNCPEKIILCIDLSDEVNRVPFISRDGVKHNPLDFLKRALCIFVTTKLSINPRHQFALVVFQEASLWMHDFTSDADDFISVIQDLTSHQGSCEVCDLTSLFETVESKVELPEVENTHILPPPYTVRMVFVYGRSSCVPSFMDGREAQKQLSKSPYFFLDVFYLHEPPTEENQCKEIFDVFLDLDKDSTSYIHEVGRNATHLFDKFAMLLAHPLQRQVQEACSYSFKKAR